jgi:hypothetical protein
MLLAGRVALGAFVPVDLVVFFDFAMRIATSHRGREIRIRLPFHSSLRSQYRFMDKRYRKRIPVDFNPGGCPEIPPGFVRVQGRDASQNEAVWSDE